MNSMPPGCNVLIRQMQFMPGSVRYTVPAAAAKLWGHGGSESVQNNSYILGVYRHIAIEIKPVLVFWYAYIRCAAESVLNE